MISPDDVAVSIVALNDGELIGRTRLQKTAFLLERCGMDSGLEFDYRHYGPFSVDLARGCDDAEFDGRLKMVERPGSREMPYTVFTTKEPAPDHLGNISASDVRALIVQGILVRVGLQRDRRTSLVESGGGSDVPRCQLSLDCNSPANIRS